MGKKQKQIVLLALGCILCTAAFGVFCGVLLSKHIQSASVRELIASQNVGRGISHIVARTELTEQYDLVFYSALDNQIDAGIMIKDPDGTYTDFVLYSTESLEDKNEVTGAYDKSIPGHSLYWGIAQSPEWKLNHPMAHQIVVDELVLGYCFYPKSLDDEILEDIAFVSTGACSS